MSASRKLQAEVERTMKKIDEGLSIFDDTWERAYDAEGPMKDKYEAELKKEIKKLQKLREQVKSWASKGDVRQKQPLLDAREKIERRMEQFKELERESKTKAYSKEGLERGMPESPESRRRRDAIDFLQECIDKLSDEVEEVEVEIEDLSSKKRPDEERMGELAETLGNHKFHIEKMELLQKLLEQEVTDANSVDELKDDIDYYMEMWREPDFFPDLDIYKEFDVLDRQQEAKTEKLKQAEAERVRAAKEQEAQNKRERDQNDKVERKTKEDGKEQSLIESTSGTISSTASNQIEDTVTDSSTAISTKTEANVTTVTSSTTSNSGHGGNNIHSTKRSTISASTAPTAVFGSAKENDTSGVSHHIDKPTNKTHVQSVIPPSPIKKVVSTTSGQPASASPIATPGVRTVRQGESMAAVLKASRPSVSGAGNTAVASGLSTPYSASLGRSQEANVSVSQARISATNKTNIGQGLNSTIHTTTVQGPPPNSDGIVSDMILDNPVDPSIASRTSLNLGLLRSSMSTIPESNDTERPKTYIPRTPAKTHSSFPLLPIPSHSTPAAFEKFGTDTLFFIFYYQQGTYQQYLAAQQLKKKSWRFHKKYSTWFRRHHDPQVSSDSSEKGTYVYFDYETSWVSRIKHEFTFSYQYLEDDVPVPE